MPDKVKSVEETKEAPRVRKGAESKSNSLIDSFIGKYKTDKDLQIGDRQLSDLIETCEKNNKKYLNVKKFETQCERHSVEEKSNMVFIWCKKMLKTWKTELGPAGRKPEGWLSTADGKLETSKYTMCKKNIKPLLKQLLNKKVNAEILNSLYIIVQYCLMREYMKADDKYLALGIGNSPWPMGVTMVGIHERSGRSRIYTSQVAHVLNDETQRKYLQAYKRLVTICKSHYNSLSAESAD
mmetsp:Transcript_31230/g.38583  ORF Transcript_31230/g.38583 Transcript_31230/m.38583 type:complete len:239 (+) Transcript_31230:263-979(+)